MAQSLTFRLLYVEAPQLPEQSTKNELLRYVHQAAVRLSVRDRREVGEKHVNFITRYVLTTSCDLEQKRQLINIQRKNMLT